MKAIKIDPFKREITAIDIAGDLRSLQETVGGLIEASLTLQNDDVIWVNEEFLYAPEKAWFKVTGNDQPLSGYGCVIGYDEGCEAMDLRSSHADIVALVTWLDPNNPAVLELQRQTMTDS